jgi:UDP-N-acetyl-2-amino-2-deoxyglucuronate dehydrogenase
MSDDNYSATMTMSHNNDNTSISQTTTNKLRLAIVGCGQIVTHHLQAMAANPVAAAAFKVVALVDPSSERRNVLATLLLSSSSSTLSPLLRSSVSSAAGSSDCGNDTTGLAQFDSLDDLIRNSSQEAPAAAAQLVVDVVFIAVPHDLHEPLAMQALQQIQPPVYVVLEKPLAVTVEALNRLVQASTDYQHRLIVAEQSPYWPEVALAKTLIQEQKAIGSRLLSASAYYYESMRDNITSGSLGKVDDNDTTTGGDGSDSGASFFGWRGSLQRAGGGIAMDGGLHWIRPLREMCHDMRIARVVGVTRHNVQPQLQLEGESLAHALFEFEATTTMPTTNHNSDHEQKDQDQEQQQPLIATYSCNMLATAPMAHDTCPYFRITGTDGELVIYGDGLFKDNPGAGGLRLYNHEHVQGKEMFAPDRMGGFFLGFGKLWEDISDMIQNENHDAMHQTVVKAADDVRVVLALYKSAKSGKWESTSDL